MAKDSPRKSRLGRQRALRLGGGLSTIYTPGEFHEVIRRECRQADRYHTRFSLALFDVGTRNENSVLIRRLVRTIHNRFRDTDEVGWYSRQQLGVILPFTPESGAWKVAEYLSEIISSITAPPAFTIYTYPSRHWPVRRFRRRQRLHNTLLGRGVMVRGDESRTPDEFHALIARERARADRNGHRFSLMVFRLQPIANNRRAVRRLVATLNQRLRDTDETGWYDEEHVGAILPYVPREDACRIADSILRFVFGRTMDLYTVYTYPESWFPESPLETASRAFPSDEARATVLKERIPQQFPDARTHAETVKPEVGEPVRTTEAKAVHGRFLYRPIPVWKRGLDIAGSLLGIVLLSPLLALTAVIVKIVSPGPVLFRQQRVGYMQRPFTLLKFRTMRLDVDVDSHTRYMRKLIVEEEEEGQAAPMTKQEDRSALIPLGRYIRLSCIDELPQLFNVLRGDMSLVGPRPCLAYEAEEFLRWHARRFDSLPGMTGLWQVSGKNRTTFKEMVRFDIQYEQRRSLWFDLLILLKTPVAIVRQIGDILKARHNPPAEGQ